MKFIRELIQKTVVEPIKRNLTLMLLLTGIGFIFVGALFGDAIDKTTYIPTGTSDSILKVGSALLGAGVFAVIMKSAQFTEFFQNNIYEVFYTPDKIAKTEAIKQKWEMLTHHLLKDNLPVSHHDATTVIRDRFFNDELQFHFEDLNVCNEITLLDDKRTIKITHTTKTDVVISPKHNAALIEQEIKIGGKITLRSLLIDNIAVNIDDCMTQDCNDPELSHFRLEIKPKLCANFTNGDKRITMERVYEYEQDITKEPFVIATFVRYVKGFTMKAKGDGCNLYFRPTGAGTTFSLPESIDGQGYSRWVLADRKTLLLPGQGYIFVVTV